MDYLEGSSLGEQDEEDGEERGEEKEEEEEMGDGGSCHLSVYHTTADHDQQRGSHNSSLAS